MRTVWQDIRYASRMLVKRPGSTLVVMSTLALVLGVMTLALGAYEQTQSDWMPFPDADRLVRLWRVETARPSDRLPASIYAEAVRSLRGLGSIAAIEGHQPFVLTGTGEPKSLIGSRVSASIFKMLGVSPSLGRAFAAGEGQSGNGESVVLSHDIWQNVFAGEPSVVGKTIRLNDMPCTVIGVMPEDLDRSGLFYGVEIWLPADFESPAWGDRWVQVAGRLKSDVSLSQLRAELDAVLSPVLQSYAKTHAWGSASLRVSAFPLDKQFGGIDVGEIVFVVAIPTLILLIACFNVTNILLGRMASRRHESAIRFSLGASRRRLVRQLLTESVLLAACGGACGMIGALWVSGWSVNRGLETQFSPSVLAAVCMATVLIGLAAGWLPAWRSAAGGMVTDLKEGSGNASGGIERHRLRNFLVTGQVAIATALCIVAGLLVRGYLNKKDFDPGFDVGPLIEVGISPRDNAYKEPEKRSLYCEQVLDRLQSLPGVAEVSVSSSSCIDRNPFSMSLRMEGDGDQWRPECMVQLNVVSPNYLRMVNLPVLRGRSLTETDRRGSDAVLLVNQAYVKAFFADADPIGRQIQLPAESQWQWFTIVGVVPDRRNLGFKEDFGPEAYVSSLQVAAEWVNYEFLLRAQTQSGALQQAIREAVRSVDYDQPVSNPQMVEAKLRRAVERDVGGVQAMTVIGVFGLMMAVLGIYGVVSNSVVERTHEIGVRVALGGRKTDMLALILRQGLKLAALGLVIGMVLATVTTFGIRQMLFGVRPVDPACYMGVCAILMGTAIAACYIPARRAAKTDPMAALRYE